MDENKQARYAKMEAFADLLEDVVKEIKPNAEFSWRKMFGGAGYYVNGVMFAGWYEADNIGFKLNETDRATLLAMDETHQGMSQHTINVPRAMLEDKKFLREWVAKSLDFAESRPPKKKKSKKK